MDPVTGYLLLGGATAAINYFGQQDTNDVNVDLARDAMRFNVQQADLNRQYQTQMSNTSYQRSVADMRAAGINPMLAYMKGGASTPGGATASAGSVPHIENSLAKGVSSAIDSARLKNEMKGVEADANFKEAAAKTQASTAIKEANNAKVAEKNFESISAQLPAIKAQAEADRKKAEWDAKAADFDAIQSRTGRVVGTITDALSVKKLLGLGKSMSDDQFKNKYDKMVERSAGKGVSVPYED